MSYTQDNKYNKEILKILKRKITKEANSRALRQSILDPHPSHSHSHSSCQVNRLWKTAFIERNTKKTTLSIKGIHAILVGGSLTVDQICFA